MQMRFIANHLPAFVWKNIGIGLLLLLALVGCEKQQPVISCPISPVTLLPESAAVDTVDSAALLKSLRLKRDSLAQKFELKQQNLPIPSYYHKTWWASYYIRGEGLMAGVDSNGVVFLIHIYNCSMPRPEEGEETLPKITRQKMCDGNTADLTLQVGEHSYTLKSSEAIEDSIWHKKNALQRDMTLGTGYYCSDYFLVLHQSDLLSELSEPSTTLYFSRTCDGKPLHRRTTVSKRARAGVHDCAELGAVIQDIRELGE